MRGKKKPRFLSKRVILPVAILAAAFLIYQGGTITRNYNYTEMLETIAKGESSGNYNAYYGNAGNSDEPDFTSMSVDDVLAWQRDYVENGSPSSAVGRYQFIRPTLEGLIEEQGIDGSEVFTAELQDRLAIALIERRGVHDYMDGNITREEFAYNLSQEWAALPKVIGEEPEESFYAGDGLNEVRISIDEIYASMDTLHLDPESPQAR